ncbi:hypothetical protein JCM4914_27230 [Streptomyces platensis subsp. malvinus]
MEHARDACDAHGNQRGHDDEQDDEDDTGRREVHEFPLDPGVIAAPFSGGLLGGSQQEEASGTPAGRHRYNRLSGADRGHTLGLQLSGRCPDTIRSSGLGGT